MRQKVQNVSKSTNYVNKQITATLIDMLEKEALETISIRDLCQQAQIGRASFYRHFTSKEQVLKTYISHISEEWMGQIFQEQGLDLADQMRMIFEHFIRHEAFYRILNRRGLIYLIKNNIIEAFGPKPQVPALEAYASAYVSYTLYGWIEVWFSRGMQETPDELASLIKG